MAGDSGTSNSTHLGTVTVFSFLAGTQLGLGLCGLILGHKLFNSIVAFFLSGLFLFISFRSAARLRKSFSRVSDSTRCVERA